MCGNGSNFDWLLKENCNVSEDKLIHMIKHSKCWRMTRLGQAALELLSFKVE